MADNAVVGALRVILGADTATFETGLKKAQSTLAAFGKSVTKAGAIAAGVLAGSAAGAAAGLGVAIKGALDEADKLGKMAQSFGIPVEQLSALKHAADLSGVSIEEVGKSVGRLARSMSEIAGGKTTGGAADAFRSIGLSATDANGKLKSTTQVMEEVADKFAGMKDGAAKTAIAISIFGRSGADLIPLLNAGAAGLKEAREEAEALGLVIDGKTAKAAENFNDNLTRLQRVLSGIALRVSAELAPALSVLSGRFVQTAKDGNIVHATSQTIIGGFQGIVIAARAVPIAIEFIAKSLLNLAQVGFAALRFDVVNAVSAFQKFKTAGAEADAAFAASRQSIQDFNDEARMLAQHFANAEVGAKKLTAPVLATQNALDGFIRSQQKAIAAQQADVMTVGLAAGARERLRLIMQAEAIAQENNIRLTDAQRMKLTELANAAQQAALQLQGKTLIEQAMPAWQQYQLQVDNARIALQSVGATAEQVSAVTQMLAEKAGMSFEQMATTALGGFKDLFTQMAKYGRSWGEFAKAIGIVEAIINTYTAFTKALSAAPPPLNYALAAGTLAAGMAKVMAIKSQQIPKMATGGRLVPNAFAGRDSVLMQARIRPDENIKVERPGEGSDMRRNGGSPTIINMQLPVGAAGRFIEELISDINSKVADGYRLNVAPA